jgi:hypothetical protein
MTESISSVFVSHKELNFRFNVQIEKKELEKDPLNHPMPLRTSTDTQTVTQLPHQTTRKNIDIKKKKQFNIFSSVSASFSSSNMLSEKNLKLPSRYFSNTRLSRKKKK